MRAAETLIKYEAKPSALFLRIARAKSCFNCFKELTHERLVNTYPFRSITESSINFVISGKTILKDILRKRFSE